MKKKERRLILILFAILAVFLVILVMRKLHKNEFVAPKSQSEKAVEKTYYTYLDDGTKLNISDKLNKSKTLGSLHFTNIQLTNNSEQTILLADVTNTSGTKTDTKFVDIVLVDNQGGELGTVSGMIAPLDAGATTQFQTSMTIDYANAYDFKFIEK